ncbi:DUF975 family protein [Spartinivicinus ruber]|uniref:hypothetical protein n=1 Tax=Spartinivicinus ruber TaxID=2683272 RepID=UPI0013D1C4ED|nr:hypothetical protein [Spartinivicinus ruber]
MSDPYAAPKSELDKPVEIQMGNLEQGLAGNYQITIGGILKESWDLVSGAKLQFFLFGLIYIAIMFLVTFINKLTGLDGQAAMEAGDLTTGFMLSFGSGFIMMPITMPLYAGVIYMGIRRAAGLNLNVSDGLSCYKQVIPITIFSLLNAIIIYIGFILLIIPGIYLTIAYMLGMPLVVDRKMGAWQALETSRKAITKHWFTIFGTFIVLLLIIMVSVIPLGIGLIWTLPFAAIAIGVMYKSVFGIETNN